MSVESRALNEVKALLKELQEGFQKQQERIELMNRTLSVIMEREESAYLSLEDLARIQRVDVAELLKNLWMVPNFGTPDCPDGRVLYSATLWAAWNSQLSARRREWIDFRGDKKEKYRADLNNRIRKERAA